MGRICNETEDQRELLEGNLACLGNCLVLLDLAIGRVEAAEKISRQSAILGPARADLERVKALIYRVQALLAAPPLSRNQ